VPNFQFGLFGICDGHSGDAAAKSVSKLVFSALGQPCLMVAILMKLID